jgi:hypothetical protein
MADIMGDFVNDGKRWMGSELKTYSTIDERSDGIKRIIEDIC